MGLFHAGSTFESVVQDIISLINLCVGVLSALAVVIFFWGLVRFISKADDAHSRAEGRSTIVWSLVALFILFSVWGILAILQVAFFSY